MSPDIPTPLSTPSHPTPMLASSGQKWYYCMSACHVNSLWVRLMYCQMYPHPHHLLNAPRVEAFGRQEWYKLGTHLPQLMFYCLQDCLEFSRVLCNRLSSFFICDPQCPHQPPLCPHPKYRHLVVKSGTTAHQHDMSSACGSGWCFVRCTSTPSMPPGRGILWPRVVLTWVPLAWAHVLLSAIDCLEFSRVLFNRPSSFFICNLQCPPSAPFIPTPQYRHLVIKSGTTACQHDMSSACGSGWCFVRCTPTPSMPPGRGILWPRVVLTSVPLTWAHVLLSAIDCLEFSWALFNRPSSFFTCNCQVHPDAPIVLLYAPPPPQYRHLVVKSSTAACQHGMSSACGSGWCFVRWTLHHIMPYAPSLPPGRGIWWPRVVQTWVHWPKLMFYCLQYPIDHLEFLRVHPHPQYRHLVLKSGTTAGKHDMWSDWCLVRCIHHPLCPHPHPQYRYLVAKSSTTSGQIDIWSPCGSGWPVYARVNLVPAAMVIPAPWTDIKVVAVKKLTCYCLQFSIDCL